MAMLTLQEIDRPTTCVLVLQPVKSSFDSREAMDAFQKELLDAIVPSKYGLVVIDFSQVAFCSSEVLGTLLHAHKLLRAGQRNLRVACLGRELDHMYQLCLLGKVIPDTPTIDAAIAAHEAG